VCLLGEAEDFMEVPIAAFEALAKQGRILRTDADQQYGSSISDKLRQASERDLKIANERVKSVRLLSEWKPSSGRHWILTPHSASLGCCLSVRRK
jgi:hypothetical protein